MFRLSIFIGISSRKSRNLTFHCSVQQIQNFASSEVLIRAEDALHKDSSQLKLWKRVKKNDPAIKDILRSPETQHFVLQLSSIMNCDEIVARELVARSSNIVASHTAVDKINLLINYGYLAEDILATPSILHRSLAVLKSRLETVQALQNLEPITLHALKKPKHDFENFIQKRKERNDVMDGYASREQFLSNLLQCDEKTVQQITRTHQFLLSHSPKLIYDKVNVLLKHQLSHGFIRENPRILVHISVLELQRRINLLNEKQLLPPDSKIKLGYLLSCQHKEFLKSLNYLARQKEALEGYKDKLEYLCHRLQCDESVGKQFLNSPSMQKLTEVKLKQTLDFLLQDLEVGADFVLKYKVLFDYSVKRLKERWTVLCSVGCKDISIFPSAISLSDKQFSAKFGSYVFVDTFNFPEE